MGDLKVSDNELGQPLSSRAKTDLESQKVSQSAPQKQQTSNESANPQRLSASDLEPKRTKFWSCNPHLDQERIRSSLLTHLKYKAQENERNYSKSTKEVASCPKKR